MPEGHSLRRLALTFDDLFVGHECALSSPQGRFVQGAKLLDGQRMTSAQSYGKHLFLGFAPADLTDSDAHLEPTSWIHIHLGMYGAWRFQGLDGVRPIMIGAPRQVEMQEHPGGVATWFREDEWEVPPPRGAVRLRILIPTCVADLTGPSRCEVINQDEKDAVISRLGPDPLAVTSPEGPGAAALRQRFVERVRESTRPVGALVLDQTVAAGVGNIYRAEGLFRIGISPFRAGNRVSVKRLSALWDDFVTLLNRGVADGKIVTVDEEIAASAVASVSVPFVGAPTTGSGGDFGKNSEADAKEDSAVNRWYVYGRAGKTCLRCGATVRAKDMQGRRLYWCPGCQR